MSLYVVVITCSDAAVADPAEDRAGAVLRAGLGELGLTVAEPVIVGNDPELIRRAIEATIADGARVVITVGGASVAPTDVTVDVTRDLLAYEIPGLMEEVRRRGAAKEPRALLSRGLAGTVLLPGFQPAVLINSPGSRGGARDVQQVVGPLLGYLVGQLDGAPRA